MFDDKENLPADHKEVSCGSNRVQEFPGSFPNEADTTNNIRKPEKNTELKKKRSISKFSGSKAATKKGPKPINRQDGCNETEVQLPPEEKMETTEVSTQGESSLITDQVTDDGCEDGWENGSISYTPPNVMPHKGKKNNTSDKVIKDQNYFMFLGAAFDILFYKLYYNRYGQQLPCEKVMDSFMQTMSGKEKILLDAKKENEAFRLKHNQITVQVKDLTERNTRLEKFKKKAEDINLQLQIDLDSKTECLRKQLEHSIYIDNKFDESQKLLTKKETLLQKKDQALESKEKLIENWTTLLSLYFQETTHFFQVVHHFFKPLIDNKTRLDFKHSYGKLLKVTEESFNSENPKFDKINNTMQSFFSQSFFKDVKDLDAKKYIQMLIKQAELDQAEKVKLQNHIRLQMKWLTIFLENQYMPEIDNDKIKELIKASASLV
ncbi:hypothetical protein MOSE0_F05776 [Monosporozyma servazzii]